jgi:ribosomal protein L29
MAIEKVEDKTNISTKGTEVVEALKPSVVDLLNEFRVFSRSLNQKNTSVRQIKRSLATIKTIIGDIEEELK